MLSWGATIANLSQTINLLVDDTHLFSVVEQTLVIAEIKVDSISLFVAQIVQITSNVYHVIVESCYNLVFLRSSVCEEKGYIPVARFDFYKKQLSAIEP